MKTPNFLRELKYQLQNFCQSKLTIFGVFFPADSQGWFRQDETKTIAKL